MGGEKFSKDNKPKPIAAMQPFIEKKIEPREQLVITIVRNVKYITGNADIDAAIEKFRALVIKALQNDDLA